MRMAFLFLVISQTRDHAVVDLHKPLMQELPVGPENQRSTILSLTWNDRKFRGSGLSCNREKEPYLPLRKMSDKYYQWNSWIIVVITGLIVVVSLHHVRRQPL